MVKGILRNFKEFLRKFKGISAVGGNNKKLWCQVAATVGTADAAARNATSQNPRVQLVCVRAQSERSHHKLDH